MRPEVSPPALTADEEQLLDEEGYVADPARLGRWIDTRGTGSSVTTSVALRRARAARAARAAHPTHDDPTHGRAPAAATAEALIEPYETETDSMDEAYRTPEAAQADDAPEGAPVPAETPDPYEAFIAAKRVEAPSGGFVAEAISAVLFPFQRDAVGWALARGCAALFSRAVTMGRRGRGHELSERYFDDMVFYVEAAERRASVPTLFDLDAALVADAGSAPGDAE